MAGNEELHMHLLPSREQYKRWSLPSKLTFIAFLIALISLIFSLTGGIAPIVEYYRRAEQVFLEEKYPENKVFYQLHAYKEAKDFSSIQHLLDKIKKIKKRQNIYHLFWAIKLAYTQGTIDDPAPLFQKVEPQSFYYQYGLRELWGYYIRTYCANGSCGKLFFEKLQTISDEMEGNNLLNSFYFVLRAYMNPIQVAPYAYVKAEYYRFRDAYTSLYNFDVFKPKMIFKKGYYVHWSLDENLLEIPAATFVFLHLLDMLSMQSGLIEENNYWRDIKRIFDRSEFISREKIELGLKALGLSSTAYSELPPSKPNPTEWPLTWQVIE